MISYDNYRIRLIDEEDLDFITNLRLSNYVQDNVGNVIFVNQINQKDWLLNVSKSNTEKFMVFEIIQDGIYQKIGMIRFSQIDWQNRSVCVGGDILEEKSGMGYGKAMYDIIFKLCFSTWGMNRVWLLVLENNKRAINLYNKVGFIDEGRQRKAIFKDGKYVDYLMMSVIEKDLKKI
ncbi:MAG: RimJ/RimL family protein N-acetyltransferase [Rickettsiales bacterium]|jgi:RimJ/RimL family protein N-acetyltransferase